MSSLSLFASSKPFFRINYDRSLTQGEIPLLKSDVNLFNHLVKTMLRVVVLRVLIFVDMRLPPIQCR